MSWVPLAIGITAVAGPLCTVVSWRLKIAFLRSVFERTGDRTDLVAAGEALAAASSGTKFGETTSRLHVDRGLWRRRREAP